MSITLKGYLRDNPGGAAVSGKTVSLLDTSTGAAPVTTAHTNLSGTTSVTDANGMWSFTMDLVTGPLRVSADLGGGNTRQRRNDELFQYDGSAISTLPTALNALNTGVINTQTPGGSASTDFAVTASATRVLTISAGYALIKGYALGWNSGTKTVTGNANGSAGTTRYDFLVLRQYYSGTSIGRQEIRLVEGSHLTDPVATTTETDLTKFIRGSSIWDLPIARGKLAFGATVYTVDDLRGSASYPFAGNTITNVPGSLTVGNLTATGTLAVTGVTTLSSQLLVNNNVSLGSGATHTVTVMGQLKGNALASPTVDTAASAVVAASGSTLVFGSDMSFEVSSTVKAGATVGKIWGITFNQSRGSNSYGVSVTPRTSAASAVQWFVTNKSGSGFELHCTGAAPTPGDTWAFSVICL